MTPRNLEEDAEGDKGLQRQSLMTQAGKADGNTGEWLLSVVPCGL